MQTKPPTTRRRTLRRLAGLGAGGWVAGCRPPDDTARAATLAEGARTAVPPAPGPDVMRITQAPPVAAPAATARAFTLFDATAYERKPDLSVFGVRPMPNLTAHRFWVDAKVDDGLPDEKLTREVGAEIVRRGTPVVIDIEHWELQGSQREVSRSIAKYVRTLQWLRSAGPMTIGMYGLMPLRDYWRALQAPDSPAYRAWQKENDALAPIAELLDFQAPSLYTFFDDRDGWVRFATENLREARRFGKPIYPFLWPQYHESSKIRGLEPIEPDYWRRQLQLVREHADGAIVWGGWDIGQNAPMTWTDDMPWWRETQAFLKTVDTTPGGLSAPK